MGEKLPSSQAAHSEAAWAPGFGEAVPASQSWQVVIEVAARTVEYFPLTQSVQVEDAEAPMESLHVPFAHLVHESCPVDDW